MRAVLKSNNPVTLSYATHILEEAGIEALVFDTHASIMDGSMAMVPRRLMVPDEDFPRADKLLRDAVPEAMCMSAAGDKFLGGKITVCASRTTGFRAGLVGVLLAGSAPSAARALDLGAGVGTASLCLAARLRDISITGIEIDPALARLAAENAAANGMGERVRFLAADIFNLPPEARRDFDSVLMNPPFHGEGQASPDAGRARALMDAGGLPAWLEVGQKRTVSGGTLTAILRADRLNEALVALPAQRHHPVAALAQGRRAGAARSGSMVQRFPRGVPPVAGAGSA